MTVRELQARLAKMDPDAVVICCTEDEDRLGQGMLFRLLQIESIDVTEGEMLRLDDGTPHLRVARDKDTRRFVTIDVTGEF